jgi:hypothetical protein
MFKPVADQTFRVSYNRAFRAPSVINNYLDVVILNQLPLSSFASIYPPVAGRVYNFPIHAGGDRVGLAGVTSAELKETEINAFEVNSTGIIAKRATVTAAWFQNETKNDVFFTQVGSYRATNQPPGWSQLFPRPLNSLFIEALYCAPGATPTAARPCPFGAGNGLPSAFSYRNFGKVRQKGVELGIDGSISAELSAFANYSYQPTPKAVGFPSSEMNLPPKHRFNLGVNYNGSRVLGNLAVNYQDKSFWQDVLDARYAGYTESYTQVNTTVGVKLGKVTRDKAQYVAQLKVVNLFNQEIQQHIFGDIFKRQVTGELRVSF